MTISTRLAIIEAFKLLDKDLILTSLDASKTVLIAERRKHSFGSKKYKMFSRILDKTGVQQTRIVEAFDALSKA